MRSYRALTTGILCAALSVAGLAGAAAFEPLFQLTMLDGKCSVKTPDQSRFGDAEDGKAYPYGTEVRTGPRSSAVIQFSEGNTCKMASDGTATIVEDAKDASQKVIRLEKGKLEIKLEPAVQEQNGLTVETVTGIAKVLAGGVFTAEIKTETDLNVAVFVSGGAQLSVMSYACGDTTAGGFEIPQLDNEDAVSIAASLDRTFIRTKDVKGQFQLKFKDGDGNERTKELDTGSVVKIWCRAAEEANKRVVTVLAVKPDGVLDEAINFNITVAPPAEVEPPTEVKPPEGEKPPSETVTTTTVKTTEGEQPPKEEEEVTTTTTTTTTTTVPSFTPVGKR